MIARQLRHGGPGLGNVRCLDASASAALRNETRTLSLIRPFQVNSGTAHPTYASFEFLADRAVLLDEIKYVRKSRPEVATAVVQTCCAERLWTVGGERTIVHAAWLELPL